MLARKAPVVSDICASTPCGLFAVKFSWVSSQSTIWNAALLASRSAGTPLTLPLYDPVGMGHYDILAEKDDFESQTIQLKEPFGTPPGGWIPPTLDFRMTPRKLETK